MAYYTIGAYKAGEEGIVLAPWRRPQPGVAIRAAMGFHGYLSDAKTAFTQPPYAMYGVPSRILGLPTLVADFGIPDTASFGNDASVALTTGSSDLAWTWLKTKTGLNIKTDKVILTGGSMGALTILNWCKTLYDSSPATLTGTVAAVLLSIPALDLQYVHDTAPSQSQGGVAVSTAFPNLAADVETSAGGAGNLTAGYYATHSPVQYAANLAAIPGRIYHTSNDVVTNAPAVVTSFLAAAGANWSAVNMGAATGTGHDASALNWGDAAAWLRSYV